MNNSFIWFGHGTFGFHTEGYKLVIDPFFTGNPAASTSADKVDPDYILVSHGHSDHVGDAEDIARRTKAPIITNAEISAWFNKKDLTTHAQHLGGGYNHPFGYLKLTLAIHGSGLPDGSYGGNPAGFLLTTKDNKKIFWACDTGLFSDMKLIGDEGIDLAVLPIGDNFTMGTSDAFLAVGLLQPKTVIPVHFNTWPIISADAELWAKRVNSETSSRALVLKPGESFEL